MPLLIIFEPSWKPREVPEDWKKANISLEEGQEGRSKKLQVSQPCLDPWEADGATNSGTSIPEFICNFYLKLRAK